MKKGILVLILILASLGLCSCGNTGNDINDDDLYKNEYRENIEEKTISNLEEKRIREDKVQKFEAVLKDGRYWKAMGIDNTCKILGHTDRYNGKSEEIILYNFSDETYETIYTLEENWSVGEAKITDKYIVWNEYLSTEGALSSYKTRLLDRSTKEISIIDENHEGISNLSIGETEIYWATNHKTDKGVSRCIMKYDINNKEKALYMDLATSPALGEGFLAWLEAEEGSSEYNILCIQNLETKEITKLTSEKSPNFLIAKGDSIIFSGYDEEIKVQEGSNKKYSICLYKNNTITKIKAAEDDKFEYPQFNGDYVSWRGTDELRIFSLRDEKIYLLPQEKKSDSDILMCNKYILWSSPINVGELAKQDAIDHGMYKSYINILNVDNLK